MTTLKEIILNNNLYSIQVDVSYPDTYVAGIYQIGKDGRMMGEFKSIAAKSDIESLGEKCYDIAESHWIRGDLVSCEVTISVDDNGIIKGTAEYSTSEEESEPIDTLPTFDSVQQALVAHKEALNYFKSFVEPLEVDIRYSGGGDDGSIECATLKKVGDPVVLDDNFLSNDLVRDWIESVVEGIGYDWYNNNGGAGDIHIEITDGIVTGLDIEAFVYEDVIVVAETLAIKADVLAFLLENELESLADRNGLSHAKWLELIDKTLLEPLPAQEDDEETTTSPGM